MIIMMNSVKKAQHYFVIVVKKVQHAKRSD